MGYYTMCETRGFKKVSKNMIDHLIYESFFLTGKRHWTVNYTGTQICITCFLIRWLTTLGILIG